MLVLERKIKESLMIGDDIKITILEVQGNSVKIGIEAPKNVLIYREEIFEAIKQENLAASGVKPDKLEELLKKTDEKER